MVELVAVLALLGLMAFVTATYTTGTLGNLGAKVEARRLSLDLIQARRRAIATGDNHLLQFTMSGASAMGYQIMRRLDDNSLVPVDDLYVFSDDVAVTPIAATAEFDFEGSALGSYAFRLNGPNRNYGVAVDALTGTVRVIERTKLSGELTPIEGLEASPVSFAR